MYIKIIKRLIDFCVSFIGIIVLLLPMGLIAIIIRIDSKGPSIFKQKRLGINKKVFTIFKFRTMVLDAFTIGGTNTSENDPRITHIGAVLRKYSIDELPQLWNILKGDMSIIGPRPILELELGEVTEPEKYLNRFCIRPGLFCTVDLILRATASRLDQFKMDVEYCNNISLLTDVKIFFGVIKTVISGTNVYKKFEI